jgi:CRP-like cAMP-binding protein
MKTILQDDKDFVCDISAPCFQNLTPDEADLVKAGKIQVIFRKGDNLTKQGAFATYVLFLVDGLARQYLEGDGTKSFNLKIVMQGEFLGLSSVFHENIFRYSAVAITECRAFLIEKETIASVIKQNGRFGFNIIRRFCEQNTSLYSSIGSIIYKQMNGRLAETLLYINSLRKQQPDIFQLLSRKDIAEFAGIATESSVKLLKAFEKDGLLELHEKDIRLIMPDKLAEISKKG